mgnify:CR=1 FL=1
MKTKTQVEIELELANARAKQPVFAANEAAGVSIIGAEFGELCKAVNEKDYEHAKLEALHVIATCIRFLEEL